MKTELNVTVNGVEYTLLAEGHRTLLEILRYDIGLTGTKSACEMGECGACTVLLNGAPVNACLVLAHETDGQEVLTIEGLSKGGELHAIQRAFIKEGAIQCGFCTPGMIVATKGLLDKDPFADENDIRESLL
ncbi:MAG: (2Fe-2S)-binding protein [Desulfatiglandaceae bacterium]|jgi:carbon-monoxide dehydrogenase small subunit